MGGTEPPCYEVSLDHAYRLGQYGRYLRIVRSRHNETASQLLEEVLLQGSMAAKDLEEHWVSADQEQHDRTVPKTNGIDHTGDLVHKAPPRVPGLNKASALKGKNKDNAKIETRQEREERFRRALRLLEEDRLLLPYHESFHRSAVDNRREAENLIDTYPNFRPPLKGPILKAAYKRTVEDKIEEWRSGQASEPREDVNEAPKRAGAKRKPKNGAGEEPEPKKPRLNGVDSSGPAKGYGPFSHHNHHSEGNEDDHLNSAAVVPQLVVNFDRLHLLLRDEVLALEAANSIGAVTSQIYARVLRLSSYTLNTCRPLFVNETEYAEMYDGEILCNYPDPVVTTKELSDAMRELSDLEHSMAPVQDASDIDHDTAQYAHRWPKTNQNISASPLEIKRKDEKERAGNDEEDEDNGKGKDDDDDDHDHRNNKDDDDDDDDDEEEDEQPYHRNPGYANGDNTSSQHDHRPPFVPSAKDHIRQHLLLLSTHRLPFLIHNPATPASVEGWVVPYQALQRAIRNDTICATIHAQHDRPDPEAYGGDMSKPLYDYAALRIARILSESRSKLDERALAARALVPAKTLRERCARLHAAGLLELQDVPRDLQRQTARSMFLWYLDPRRAATRLADAAMADMVRLLKRRHRERFLRRAVLDKAERSDVKGKEDDVLDDSDRAVIARWRTIDAGFWAAFARLGVSVDVLTTF